MSYSTNIPMIPSVFSSRPSPLPFRSRFQTLTPTPLLLTLHPFKPRRLVPLSSGPTDSTTAAPVFNFEDIVEKDWSFTASPDEDRADKARRIIAASAIRPDSRILLSMGTAEFVDRLVESAPCEIVLAVHESLLELALVKEKHDGVRCWQGGVEAVPERFVPVDVVFLCYLPGMGVSLDQVFGSLAGRCSPGARLVISSDQGRYAIKQHRQQFPDMVTSDLPDINALEKAAAAHSFHISEFVDEPTFYLAVLRYSMRATKQFDNKSLVPWLTESSHDSLREESHNSSQTN